MAVGSSGVRFDEVRAAISLIVIPALGRLTEEGLAGW
jgi:hypothetical protein